MRTSDIIKCTVWAAFFLAAIAVVPVAGVLVGLLTPLPFTYYLFGLQPRYALQFVFIVTVGLFLLALLGGVVKLGLFALEFGAVGFTLAYALQNRLSIGWSVGLGTAVLVGVSLVIVALVAISEGSGPVKMIKGYLVASLTLAPDAHQTLGVPPEKTVEMKAYLDMVRNAILRIYPSLMVVGSGFVVWLNVMLARSILRSRGIDVIEKKELVMWKAPEQLVWGVILSGFALFLPFDGIRFAALNVLIFFMAVYLFQGMAIVSYFLNRLKAPTWLRIILYFFIAIQQFFLVVLALGGLFDQWVNFRRAGMIDS
ncbi:MAG: hypothetical protein DRH15_02435 [Deltaproteobacteria bacterium]|nr:MAG: hypothetical protein DRH15_02435 [Deltaproteobacteria bacterium]